MKLRLILSLSALLVVGSAAAQPNSLTTTNPAAALNASRANSSVPTNRLMQPAVDVEKVRDACINGRRAICGKVIKVLPDGLVVDSGYTALLQPPFGESWAVSSGALVKRDKKAIEKMEPAAPCIGLVFLTDIPKRPPVKQYDYVVLMAYPAGRFIYTPFPDIRKPIRKFSAGLETAVRLTIAADGKPAIR